MGGERAVERGRGRGGVGRASGPAPAQRLVTALLVLVAPFTVLLLFPPLWVAYHAVRGYERVRRAWFGDGATSRS